MVYPILDLNLKFKVSSRMFTYFLYINLRLDQTSVNSTWIRNYSSEHGIFFIKTYMGKVKFTESVQMYPEYAGYMTFIFPNKQ